MVESGRPSLIQPAATLFQAEKIVLPLQWHAQFPWNQSHETPETFSENLEAVECNACILQAACGQRDLPELIIVKGPYCWLSFTLLKAIVPASLTELIHDDICHGPLRL